MDENFLYGFQGRAAALRPVAASTAHAHDHRHEGPESAKLNDEWDINSGIAFSARPLRGPRRTCSA